MSAAPTRYRVIIALVVIVGLLGVLRALAPSLITGYVNSQMTQMGDYRGQIANVDLVLWRGAYVIRSLTIQKRESGIEQPLLSVPRVDASLQWRALLHGEVVADARLTEPVVMLVQQGTESQYGENTDWRAQLESLLPIRVNRVEITRGRLAFLEPDAQPPVELFLSNVEATVANLTNVRESPTPVFTGLTLVANAMGHAPLRVRARLDPLQQPLQFDLNVDLRELELTRLNPLLMRYAKLNAEGGTFSLSAEVAAADGNFAGYVKPLLDHAEFSDSRDFRERPLGAIRDAIAGALTEMLENQPHDRIGTRIPIKGRVDPTLELWPAVGGVLGNMFDALLEGIDDSVDLRDALDASAACSSAICRPRCPVGAADVALASSGR